MIGKRLGLIGLGKKRGLWIISFITGICVLQILGTGKLRVYFDSIFYEDDIICKDPLNFSVPIKIFNSSAAAEFRMKVDDHCDIRKSSFFNTSSLHEDDNYSSEFQPGKIIKISKELYSIMYDKNIFKKSLFRRCAVVGNGGILKGSHCGHEIDSADFVFRCNLAPLKGHKKDVGWKSNITSMNPSIIHNYFHYLQTATDQKNFDKRLHYIENQYLLIWVFVHNNEYEQLKSFAEYYTKVSSRVRILLVNPMVKRKINTFWIKNRKLKATLPSTGLYLMTMAVAACHHVTLYGFYPCMNGPNNEQLAYHYYESTYFATHINGHHMSEEYKILKELESQGIISIRYHC